METLKRFYRKIFPATEYEDFEDWAISFAKGTFFMICFLLVIVVIIAAAIGEQRDDVNKLNRRIEALEKECKR